MNTLNWRKCSTSIVAQPLANNPQITIIFRERENHSAHLASIEAELDSQVAKVEAAARRQAQQDFEAERRAMQEKMEAEVTELQTHLRSVRLNIFCINHKYGHVHVQIIPKSGPMDEQR